MANQKLRANGQYGLYLALAGAGSQELFLRDCALQAGVDTHVLFLGFQTDLRPLWAVSSMAVFASEAEGLCTALIEAQGAGLPAAVSRAGGMPEVIEDNATGVIFEIGSIENRFIFIYH